MIGLRQHFQGAVLRWRDLELATQYLIASVSMVLLVSAVSGMLISAVLNQSEINERTQQTALFLDGVFSTMLQDVADGGEISHDNIARMDTLMAKEDFGIGSPTSKFGCQAARSPIPIRPS